MPQDKYHDISARQLHAKSSSLCLLLWGSFFLGPRPTATPRKTKLVMIPTTRAGTAKIGVEVGRPASLCQIGPEATGYPQKNYFRCQLFDQSFCANGVLRSERKRRIPTRLSARAAIDLGAPKEDSGDHTTFFFCF